MGLELDGFRYVNVLRSEQLFGILLKDWSPTDWACAASGELGELCNKIKKRFLRGETDITIQEIADEIADTITYLDLLAASLDINLSEAIISKFNSVTDRFPKEQHPGNTHRLPY